MRVTQNQLFQNSLRSIQSSLARVFEAQQQVASGKRITTPSDDPAVIARLLYYRERAAELDQFGSNVSQGKTFVDSSASILEDVSELSAQARELLIAGTNGTLSDTERAIIAEELTGLIDEAIALGNSRVGNRYIFGGAVTDRPPFELVTDPLGRTTLQYNGNDDRITTEIGPGFRTSTNVPGSEIFMNFMREATDYFGDTGAAQGSGTDSATGVGELTVAHTLTSYPGAGGIGVGASTANDTIIGNHTVTLDVDPSGTTGTISLNGGTPVSFNNPDNDVRVEGPGGEVIYVNTAGATAGFSGDVTITGQGTLSLDGGATTTVIAFSGNQQLLDPASGGVVNVDSSGIRQAGTDKLTFTGTFDYFGALIAARDALLDAGSSGDVMKDLDFARGMLAEVDRVHEDVLTSLGELGVMGSRLEASATRLEDLDVRFRSLVSDTQDVDYAEAVIELQQSETAYQSALLVSARVDQLSLLNYV